MTFTYIVFAFLFGMIFGSFYNVVGLRVPKKQSIITPPSHCTACQRQLSAIDLVPIFSYLVLKGRCRTCGVKISPIYMLTELLTGVLFAYAYYQIGWQPELLVALLFISLLVIIVVSDIAYMLIPDKILLFFLPLLVIARILSPLTVWWDSIVGAFVAFTILYIIAIVSKGGMGGGDIKLYFLIGLTLGTLPTLLSLFLAALIGMIIGALVLTIQKKGRKTPVPFGPSIAIASIIVYFHGQAILNWYSHLF